MYSYEPLHMAMQKQGGQLEPTYSSSVRIQGCSPGDLLEAMNDGEEWRERVRDIRADGTTRWWWNHVEFIEECEMCTEKHILVFYYESESKW